MYFTKYGKSIAEDKDTLDAHVGDATGATAHMRACSLDTERDILLVGHDVDGKRFTMRAKSVAGAYFKMAAAWGLERAWHVREDGTRKLVIRR